MLLLTIAIALPHITLAQYQPLSGGLGGLDGNASLAQYFNALFNIVLTLGAILAVIMIAIGGFQYMTTEAASAKQASKTRIQQAILGLLMLLSVYIFYSEINPDILKLDITQQ